MAIAGSFFDHEMANDVEFATRHATAGSSRKSVAGRHRPKCSSKVKLAERSGSDTHHDVDHRDGFREALKPSYDLLPGGQFDLPDGQISDPPVICMSSPPCKNILFFRTPNQNYMIRRPVPQRGDTRSSRPRGGMRWTPMVQLTRALEADGEDVWS